MEEYDPAVHTAEKAQRDADALYKAGEGRWGTDEETFIKILFSSPCEYLALLNEVYKNKYRSDLEAAVRCEFSGYATEALLHFGTSRRRLSRRNGCEVSLGNVVCPCTQFGCRSSRTRRSRGIWRAP
jgi:hypothetical protein